MKIYNFNYFWLALLAICGLLPGISNDAAAASCLTGTVNFSGSAWYASGTVTVTNSCSTNVALTGQSISFTAQDSKGNAVSVGTLNDWWVNNAAYTLTFSGGATQSGTFGTTTSGATPVINAGQTLTFSGGFNLNNSAFNNALAASSLTFGSSTPTPTPTPTPGGSSITTGSVGFHLLLGVNGYTSAQDSITLTGDNYTDLIMSNFIAGVMYGHLLQKYTPGIQFDKDYLYGSIMGQLLQENLATEYYKASSNLIDPSPDQAAVMGMGQGGPYQINNYAADMVYGSYKPQGNSLINYVAVQKNIGFTMADAATQYTQNTPASFNNKYYGPILTAYFHFNDYVALQKVGPVGGYTPGWEPYFDKALTNFKTLPNNFLDVLLNVAYNQGYYGTLMTSYSKLGANASAATVANVNLYSSVWGVNDTYQQYPYQVRYYLDQLYDNPIPSPANQNTVTTPANHVAFSIATLESVFSNVFQTLGYVNGSKQYVFISDAQARTAFNSALSSAGVASTSTLDLSTASQRAQIFSILEAAISNLESSLGTDFTATTLNQL
ncbi:hypothetical protein RP726_11560 [Candidatus Methylospira mobilis]|uniref:hypothetical protein n=1 Tax=Candidatus Methylospira mobilis TaxID=1808979 RepID=UPI0028E3E1B8|nr:hypothetical protein [Candidatus Methylospira mobilis]WNV03106.1 hypothetical protein RP726_11560 [Candidatus Methylospira mobilis]